MKRKVKKKGVVVITASREGENGTGDCDTNKPSFVQGGMSWSGGV